MMPHPPVSHFYEDDHNRLDQLFQEFQRLKRNDFTKAREVFSQFYIGIERHILLEEEVLFRIFEDKNAVQGLSPTAVMRSEHTQTMGLLEVIHQKLLEGSQDTDREEALLLSHLAMHNMKEEKILYPAIDRLITQSDRDRIFKDMKKLGK